MAQAPPWRRRLAPGACIMSIWDGPANLASPRTMPWGANDHPAAEKIARRRGQNMVKSQRDAGTRRARLNKKVSIQPPSGRLAKMFCFTSVTCYKALFEGLTGNGNLWQYWWYCPSYNLAQSKAMLNLSAPGLLLWVRAKTHSATRGLA